MTAWQCFLSPRKAAAKIRELHEQRAAVASAIMEKEAAQRKSNARLKSWVVRTFGTENLPKTRGPIDLLVKR